MLAGGRIEATLHNLEDDLQNNGNPTPPHHTFYFYSLNQDALADRFNQLRNPTWNVAGFGEQSFSCVSLVWKLLLEGGIPISTKANLFPFFASSEATGNISNAAVRGQPLNAFLESLFLLEATISPLVMTPDVFVTQLKMCKTEELRRHPCTQNFM